MYKPNGLDRKSLQTQLENYKLIAEVNQELLGEDLFTKADLPGKLALAQSYINESHQWEELSDQTKCHDALTKANIAIVDAGVVIKLMLNQGDSLENAGL